MADLPAGSLTVAVEANIGPLEKGLNQAKQKVAQADQQIGQAAQQAKGATRASPAAPGKSAEGVTRASPAAERGEGRYTRLGLRGDQLVISW